MEVSRTDAGDPQRMSRYRFNGWYNLGVTALRTGNCDQALENLDEAGAIDPDDADLLGAIDLAGDCGRGQRDTFWQDVKALPVHALED